MKNKKIYYKIGEVCTITGLKPSVLRFWEKEFKELKPLKTGSNHRYYTNKNIEFIDTLKQLLYDQRLTIEGARKKISSKETGVEVTYNYIKEELRSILSIMEKR